MKTTGKHLILVLLAILLTSSAVMAQDVTPDGSQVRRQAFTVDLGDFNTKAELTYPADGEGPFPTVILIHGSTPADMDFTVMDMNGTVLSQNFKDIAEYLPQQGFAVIRYNKHYVSGVNQVDQAKYVDITLQQLVKDAKAVLDSAAANALVDAQSIFLYGWSEGSTVAAQVAVDRAKDIKGLIVQGPVALGWRETFKAQIMEVSVPYARQYATDGKLNDDGLTALVNGTGGGVARLWASFMIDRSYFQSGKFTISQYLDQNHDEAISIDEEFVPVVDQLLDIVFGTQALFGMYAPNKALPTVSEQAPHLKLPILILQGKNDANTVMRGAEALDKALEQAGNPDHTLKLYDGLGHSLGKADNLIDDNFRPIEDAPLHDMVTWLKVHAI